jgi:hypothetical protein
MCVSAFLLISALVLVALPASPTEAEAGTDLTGAELDNLTILHIGEGVVARQLVDRLEEMGGHVVSSADIPEAAELNPEVAIIFGGEWLEQRAYDTKLHDFLRVASSHGASMVMAGGTTFKFFEMLDRAGLYKIPVTETGMARNPGYFNPPLVGLKMKTVSDHMVPSFLLGSGSSPDVLEESLIGWLASTTSTVLGPPYLQSVTEYYYSPLLDSNPHGSLDLVATIYKLKGDGVPGYDWYLYDVKLQSVPGKVAYPDSTWVNDYTWAHHQVFDGGTGRWLVDYAPTTTYGIDAVDVSLGVSLAWPWSYSIQDIVVLDESDYDESTAYWQHNIDQGKPVAANTYLSEPGFVVKTTQDNWSFVDGWYKARFAKPFAWWWSTSTLGPSPTLMLDAFQLGD